MISADGSVIECKPQPEFAKGDEKSRLSSSRGERWATIRQFEPGALLLNEEDTGKYAVARVGFAGGSNVDVFRQLVRRQVREDVRLHAEWLKVMLKRNRDNNLLCFLSPAVFNSIAPLCTALLEQTRTAVSSLIGDIVKESVADLDDRFPRLKALLLSSIEESA